MKCKPPHIGIPLPRHHMLPLTKQLQHTPVQTHFKDLSEQVGPVYVANWMFHTCSEVNKHVMSRLLADSFGPFCHPANSLKTSWHMPCPGYLFSPGEGWVSFPIQWSSKTYKKQLGKKTCWQRYATGWLLRCHCMLPPPFSWLRALSWPGFPGRFAALHRWSGGRLTSVR